MPRCLCYRDFFVWDDESRGFHADKELCKVTVKRMDAFLIGLQAEHSMKLNRLKQFNLNLFHNSMDRERFKVDIFGFTKRTVHKSFCFSINFVQDDSFTRSLHGESLGSCTIFLDSRRKRLCECLSSIKAFVFCLAARAQRPDCLAFHVHEVCFACKAGSPIAVSGYFFG